MFPKEGKKRGHPTWIYSARPQGSWRLEHQIFLTLLFNVLRDHMKGFAVGSQCKFNEDLTFVAQDDGVIRWEIDRGVEGKARVQSRLAKLAGCEDMIVFATVSPARIKTLKKWAAGMPVRDQLYFCLIEEAIIDPFKAGLIEDINGERYEVYRNQSEPIGL